MSQDRISQLSVNFFHLLFRPKNGHPKNFWVWRLFWQLPIISAWEKLFASWSFLKSKTFLPKKTHKNFSYGQKRMTWFHPITEDFPPFSVSLSASCACFNLWKESRNLNWSDLGVTSEDFTLLVASCLTLFLPFCRYIYLLPISSLASQSIEYLYKSAVPCTLVWHFWCILVLYYIPEHKTSI